MISAAGPYEGGDDFVIIYLKKILSALKKGLKGALPARESYIGGGICSFWENFFHKFPEF